MLVGGLTATMLLLLHIATITYEYEIPKSPFRSASKTESKRVLLKDVSSSSIPLCPNICNQILDYSNSFG